MRCFPSRSCPKWLANDRRRRRASLVRRIGLSCILVSASAPLSAQCEDPEPGQALQTPAGYWHAGQGKLLGIEGDTALVGQPGLVHVFERDAAGLWSPVQVVALPIQATNGTLSVHGDLFVVGDPNASASAGAAAIFERDAAGAWSFSTLLESSSSTPWKYFGILVDVWGERVAVGAMEESAVYLFERDASGAWMEVEKFLSPATPPGQDGFGLALALEADRLVIGAYVDDEAAQDSGAVYVYERDGAGVWQQKAKLFSNEPMLDTNFGSSVTLHGQRLAIGSAKSRLELLALDDSGIWTFEDEITAGDGSDFFGASVALYGQDLAVGAPWEDISQYITEVGGVYLFQRQSKGQWVQTAHLHAPLQCEGCYFGRSVALQQGTLLAGAPGVPSLGAAYGATAFEIPVGITAYCTSKQNSQGCTPPMSWTGETSVSGAAHLRLRATDVINQSVGVLFYSKSGEPLPTPFQNGYLCVGPTITRTNGQASGGNAQPSDCSGSFSFDFTQYVLDGVDPALVPGSLVWAQYWYRDPASASTTGLSDAVRFALCP